ncbi:6-chlorohydroxyquinol-1,2-dioxygenase [Scheffersomyces xylosifermentans]|uniref:6-chlorohydroxyquinol-1,2-dioxygenase n=1 Tax=Scheffersomyces xylosifermentans TaxID=1304137 RepID=UPI00315DD65F
MPASTKSSLKIVDMSDETITQNTIAINSQHDDRRLLFVLERLVQHLHDFARETRLTTEEWEAGIQFLTQVGQKCTDLRQEFVLLSDILGFSVLVDSISHPKPKTATIGTLLGPFHTHDAQDHENGTSICSEDKGEPLLIEGRLTDTQGNPIEGATIDLWHCDKDGLYDTQYADREEADMRGIYHTKADGTFVVKATKPVPYPIPHDGPVGALLKRLNRHPYRPAHIHFIIEKEGYDRLITALYHKGDPYETSDAVFGVKSPLLFSLDKLGKKKAQKYNMNEDDWYLPWDFKIITDAESRELIVAKNTEALQKLGRDNFVLSEAGLPIAAPLD